MRNPLQYFCSACTGALAFALLSGCGSTSAENASLAQKSLQASNARLKIHRTSLYVQPARVKLDGREIADLGSGGSTMLDVSAGPHKIEVDERMHPNKFAMTLNAKPGMLYTLEIAPRAEAAVASVAFGLVGMFAEAAINENGGTFQIRVVDEKPINR